MSDIRTLSPRVLAGLDHAAHGSLLPVVAEALEEEAHEIDLQVERVGAEYFLDVHVLLADLLQTGQVFRDAKASANMGFGQELLCQLTMRCEVRDLPLDYSGVPVTNAVTLDPSKD